MTTYRQECANCGTGTHAYGLGGMSTVVKPQPPESYVKGPFVSNARLAVVPICSLACQSEYRVKERGGG